MVDSWNSAVLNDAIRSGQVGGGSGGGNVKAFSYTGDGNAPANISIPEDVGFILTIERDDTGAGSGVMPFPLKASGKYVLCNHSDGTITGAVSYTYSNNILTLGAGVVGVDEVFNRGGVKYTIYYMPIEVVE